MSEQSQKLDINIVNPEELMTLQGIGPQLASRIIAARPFSDLEDMRRDWFTNHRKPQTFYNFYTTC